MTLPAAERLSLEAILAHYCEKKMPLRVRHQVLLQFRIEGNIVTLFEKRVSFRDRSKWIEEPVARFKHVKIRNQWELYWLDRNSRWHFYPRVRLNRSIEPLLAEVDYDPTHIFWG